MVDGNMLDFLVRRACLKADDIVLEVGAGTGFLTERIAEAAGHVVSVEIDKRLCAIVNERLGGCANLVLLNRDALEGGGWDPVVGEAVARALEKRPGAALKMVANLPYCIATGAVTAALTGTLPFSGCWFTCQREVAGRLTAAPGTSEYGYIAVMVALLAEVRILRRLPPTVFWPRPKVESAVVEVIPAGHKALGGIDISHIEAVVSALFTNRRKQTGAALKALKFDQTDILKVEKVLVGHGLSLAERVFRLAPLVILEIAGGIHA
jgi:16S rRNA (adenine1518-N6/adenine1519-N6)-dimethyltransferase